MQPGEPRPSAPGPRLLGLPLGGGLPAAGGDIDYDGYADILVSAVRAEWGAVEVGITYLFYGGEKGVFWWEMCAIIVVMIIPVIIMSVLLTRFISRGVLLGAVKG